MEYPKYYVNQERTHYAKIVDSDTAIIVCAGKGPHFYNIIGQYSPHVFLGNHSMSDKSNIEITAGEFNKVAHEALFAIGNHVPVPIPQELKSNK